MFHRCREIAYVSVRKSDSGTAAGGATVEGERATMRIGRRHHRECSCSVHFWQYQ
jgi:hypothetical protein